MRSLSYDIEDYERECEKIRDANKELLELFETDLAGFSEKTIRRHIGNVDFYINNYLLYEDARTFEDGIVMIADFLGYFFIRKCMWSTPASIRSTATSIKKFYKCMVDHEKISKEDYEYLCNEIKIGMPDWQADCEQYNDPYSENPFAFI